MPAQRIWLIGGTTESVQIAQAIAPAPLNCIISVTTEAARSLYPTVPNLKIWVGQLTSPQVKMFIIEHSVVAILDASHPYAVEISQVAITAATNYGIPYLRFERPTWECAADEDIQGVVPHPPIHPSTPLPLYFPNFPDLLASNCLIGHRVLLTIGYRYLPLFQSWQDRATLFARILPSVVAVETALAAGFGGDRLIALRPPINFELEMALWQQWQISLVVTKASGAPGGEDVKQRVAAALGVGLVTIERPAIDYPQQTSDLGVAIEFCHQLQPLIT
jgi:precorrin-6A/cobalt-precorrin-6A reductase